MSSHKEIGLDNTIPEHGLLHSVEPTGPPVARRVKAASSEESNAPDLQGDGVLAMGPPPLLNTSGSSRTSLGGVDTQSGPMPSAVGGGSPRPLMSSVLSTVRTSTGARPKSAGRSGQLVRTGSISTNPGVSGPCSSPTSARSDVVSVVQHTSPSPRRTMNVRNSGVPGGDRATTPSGPSRGVRRPGGTGRTAVRHGGKAGGNTSAVRRRSSSPSRLAKAAITFVPEARTGGHGSDSPGPRSTATAVQKAPSRGSTTPNPHAPGDAYTPQHPFSGQGSVNISYVPQSTGVETPPPPHASSLVDALSRIANVLERGDGAEEEGDSSVMVGLANALKSLASTTPTVTPDVSLGSIPGDGTQRQRGQGTSSVWLPPVLSDLEARIADLEGDKGTPCDRSELTSLRQRTERLEYELAELRAQTARRLDAAAREVAVGRREAEEARSETVVLRAKVADLTSLLAQSPAAVTPTPNGQHI